MDKHNSENILDEILNRDPSTLPSPASHPPKFELPPPEETFTNAPEKKSGQDWAALLLPWLCMVLGAALLVLGICVLQVVGINTRLDGLQQAVEAVQAVDGLREENVQLQRDLERAKNETEQAKSEQLQLYSTIRELSQKHRAMQKLQCLWYVGHFMDTGNYPMAALVMMYSIPYASDFQKNPLLLEQYLAYHDELLEKGWLISTNNDTGLTTVTSLLNTKLYPHKDPDMAVLGILWCALEAYYVNGYPGAAAQYLVGYQDYPLSAKDSTRTLSRYLRESASEDTLWLYNQLVLGLVEDGYLVETGGVLNYNPDFGQTDELYPLPFELPTPDPASIPLG